MAQKISRCAFVAAFALLAAASLAAAEGPPLPREEAIKKTQEMATNFTNEFRNTLTSFLSEGDYLKAIEGCSGATHQIVRDYNDRTGYYIRRVSLKYRNQTNSPDSFEKERLVAFDKLAKEIRLADDYEDIKGTFEDGKRYMRYMRPLIVEEMCLKCHGSKDDIPEQVQQFLKQVYPNDRAKDHKIGDVRGAVSIKIPLTFQ